MVNFNGLTSNKFYVKYTCLSLNGKKNDYNFLEGVFNPPLPLQKRGCLSFC